jgi:hypothetical protein
LAGQRGARLLPDRQPAVPFLGSRAHAVQGCRPAHLSLCHEQLATQVDEAEAASFGGLFPFLWNSVIAIQTSFDITP